MKSNDLEKWGDDMKKGVKVIYQRNDESLLHGINVNRINYRNGGVIYKLDEWVKPAKGCGPLCVFDGEEKATNFCRYFGVYVTAALYHCDYEPHQGIHRRRRNAMHSEFGFDHDGFVMQYPACCWYVWMGVWLPGQREYPLHKLPDGTVLADKVKLTEFICWV